MSTIPSTGRSAVFCTLLLAACASTKPLEERPLPFHVAIMPMEAPVTGRVSDGELPGKPTELRLNLEPEQVTTAVSEALDQYCFSHVTVLDASDLEEGVGVFERQRILKERAREAGADLVVDLGLRYDEEIYRKNSSTFWLNYPLFLFAGPSNWFLGDNQYYADVELTTAVYDLHALEAGNYDVGDNVARVVSASSRYSGTGLDFIDRSDGVEDYLLGIIIPSGFLSRESKTAEEQIHDAVIKELRTLVVRGVQSRRHELVLADQIAPVFVEPAECSMWREGDDVVVKGWVRLREDSLAERVRELRIDAGGDVVRVEPEPIEGTEMPGYEIVGFETRVPVAADADRVRIRCEAGTRDRFVRSYTFALPTQ